MLHGRIFVMQRMLAEIKHFAFYFVFVSESLSIYQSLRKIRKHYGWL